MKPRSLYLHIPFCRRKCFYCDFAITTGGKGLQEEYVDVLCQEINHTIERQTDRSWLDTVFFGGGTPSLLSGDQIDRVLNTIKRGWDLAEDGEVSLEANPGTVSLEALQSYRARGVNRLSLGAQAFQDELLDRCGRGHTVAEIYEAVDLIKQAGFHNFNIDLIAGLPGQRMKDWEWSLQQTIGLNPTHVSVYDLTIEAGTLFGKRYKAGQFPLPSEEMTVEMYKTAHVVLTEAGYFHYEISNYAKPGYACRHNLTYWQNQPFYGFGMGAASYVDGYRWERPRKIRPYMTMVQNKAYPSVVPEQQNDRLFDTLMQGLRLAEGLSLADLYQSFGEATIKTVCHHLLPFVEKGWLEITDRLRLVVPEGWLFSDVVNTALYNLLTTE